MKKLFLIIYVALFNFSLLHANGVDRNPFPPDHNDDKVIFNVMDVEVTVVKTQPPPYPGFPEHPLWEKKLGRLHCGRYGGNSVVTCFVDQIMTEPNLLDLQTYEKLMVNEVLKASPDKSIILFEKKVGRLTCYKYVQFQTISALCSFTGYNPQ